MPSTLSEIPTKSATPDSPPQAVQETVERKTMLSPAAYSETAIPALRLARSSRTCRRIAKVLFAVLILTIIVMAFAPWQQSITGSGSVLAFAPDQRQQSIQSPIKGRIVRWGEGIYENALVSKGEFIAEIRDLDASYADRLDSQLENSQQTVRSVQDDMDAKRRALEAAKSTVESLERQVMSYKNVKREIAAAQDAFVMTAEQKVAAEQQQLAEYEAAIPQIQAEFERLQRLQAAGNISLQKLQEVERKLNEAKAKVQRAEAYYSAAKSELAGKKRERLAKIEKAQTDVDYAEAGLQKASSDVSKLESEIAKVNTELMKAGKTVLDMEVKVARQKNQIITAPFDGFIVSINPNQGTAILKEGDPICTIVPQTTDRSVQLWLDGNDAPLVEPGREVRLQFEGWPAVQFAGWPSVAVGTFGGQVVSVDAIDNGMGKYRTLIRPGPEDEWPEDRFLRQGVRANGWVLLDQVPMWYEVWRNLNGFPPVADFDTTKKNPKPPKLPK